MVFAVGMNPAIDRTLVVPGFAIGSTLKAESVGLLPGGKGANIAAVLRLLDVDVRYVGFVGREESDAFRERLGGVPCDIVDVRGRTRTDTTIIDPGISETHIREPGFSVSVAQVDEFVALLGRHIGGGDTAVLSGSLPPGAPTDTYATIVALCRKKGAEVLLDTSGEALRFGAAAVPTLMKPNLEELGELAAADGESGSEPREVAAIASAARTMIGRGVRGVAVSLGGDGAILVDDTGAWIGNAEVGEVVNTVGCGDAFAAGWLAARLAGGDPADQLREALVLGAANAMSHGAGEVNADHIETMLERAVVSPIT